MRSSDRRPESARTEERLKAELRNSDRRCEAPEGGAISSNPSPHRQRLLDSPTLTATPPFGVASVPTQATDALHHATLDLLTTDDPGAIAGKALSAAGRVLSLETASIWVPSGEHLVCRGALGEHR